jgi:SAM-dependent methyltransferase
VEPVVTWLPEEDRTATCPLCGADGPKPQLLRVTTLGLEQRPIELVRCPACELRFFPDLREPNTFAAAPEQAIDEHFELGIGLRGSVECLGRIDRARVRSMLEVGCGTGLTLDWARHVHGWEVLGADTSAMSERAVRELGVPIAHELVGAGGSIPAGAWDLVFACEVLEHVLDPAAFLAGIRQALAPGGVFLLRTPAAEGLAPERDAVPLVSILSPGYHPMLHTAGSLRRLLHEAGFGAVEVLREGDTLHAAASADRFAWDPEGTLPPDAITGYLRARPGELPVGSAARQGLLQQLANEAVNRGDTTTADTALEQLDATLRARHGAGLDAPAPDVPPIKASAYAFAFVAAGLAAALAGDRERALDRFVAAADTADVGIALTRQLHAWNEGAEHTRRLALQQAYGLAGDDPELAGRLLERLIAVTEETDEAAVLELFTQAVGRGSFTAAGLLAADVERILAAGTTPPDATRAREARWALAMLLLHAAGRPADAAAQFALAAAEAADPQRLAAARFHEGYARWHAGDRETARPLLRETVEAAEEPGSGAAEWAGQAAALLEASYAG